MAIRTLRTPRSMANWTGIGKLYQMDDLVAQVEYGMHVWKEQEPSDETEMNAPFKSSGSFMTIGFEPDIEEGSELLLEFQDGKRASVVIVSYDLGQGSFVLTRQALNKLFSTD